MSSDKKIHVLIADDHAIVRQGLRQILSETDDLLVAGEAGDGVDAMRLARQQQWDVVLLDVTMPNRNGIDTLKMLKKEFPRLPVLILSMHEEDQYAVRAIRAGASGYLTKQSAPELLVTAIRQVASGHKYVSPSLAMKLADVIAENDDRPAHESLSDREYQTLCLIAAGRPLTQIAEELNISVKTVSEYRKRILEKMKLDSNAELIHYGLKHGLVE
jgi:DNA-binding NarL/FixJ family response regulator